MQFITVHSAPGEPIGQHAFENCSSLEAIFLPPTVTKIDSKPFCKCKSLRTINFLDTVAVQYLGYNVIPDSGQHFGYYIVAGCDDLLTDEAKSHVSDGNSTIGSEIDTTLSTTSAGIHPSKPITYKNTFKNIVITKKEQKPMTDHNSPLLISLLRTHLSPVK